MIQFGGCHSFHKFHQVVQLYHLSLVVPDINRLDVGRLVTLLAVDLSENLILLAIHVEIAHALPA